MLDKIKQFLGSINLSGKLQSLLKGTFVGFLAFFAITVVSVNVPEAHRKALREVVGNKVVKILKPGSKGGGTGFFVKAPSGKTYIMTNYHVCQLKNAFNQVEVVLPNSKRIRRDVIQMYPNHDLCLVETIDGYEGITVAESDFQAGDSAFVIGHPKLYPLTVSNTQIIGTRTISLYYSKSAGMVHDIITEKDLEKMEFTEALEFLIMTYSGYVRRTLNTTHIIGYSRGGNSGSPIVDNFGRVKSVLFAGMPSDNLDSYGVPLIHIKELLKGR